VNKRCARIEDRTYRNNQDIGDKKKEAKPTDETSTTAEEQNRPPSVVALSSVLVANCISKQ
jgi:hypothetical protein